MDKKLDVPDEVVMTRFLLGDSRSQEQEQVEERLSADPAYFEMLCALEDELILKWHRGELSDDERRLFADAYLSTPARQARVEAGRQLIEAAEAVKASNRARPSVWVRMRQWLPEPQHVPRFAMVGGVAVLVVAVSAAVYLTVGAPRLSQTEAERTEHQGANGPRVIATFVLTPPGERGLSGETNLVRIPEGADELRLQFEIAYPHAGSFEAEIEAIDSGRVISPAAPPTVRGTTASVVTQAVAASGLPDGDYVLRLRAAGGSVVIASRTFRVTRE